MIKVERGIDRAKRQAVGLSDAVNVVRADDVTGTRHVLHDDRRIAGNMLANMTRRKPCPKIVAAGGGRRDDDGDGFAVIKGRLGRRPFKVQGVQKFKGQKKQSKENPIEPLNF